MSDSSSAICGMELSGSEIPETEGDSFGAPVEQPGQFCSNCGENLKGYHEDDENIEQNNRFAVPWGAKDAFFLFLLAITFIIVSLVVFTIAFSLAGFGKKNGQASYVSDFGLNIVFYGAILLAVLAYFKKKGYKITPAELGFRGTPVGPAILWTLLIIFLDFTGSGIWSYFVSQPALPLKHEYGSTVVGFLLAFIGIALLAPVVEEMFFRGVLFPGFSKRFGLIIGGFLSALLFAIAHVDPHLYGRIFLSGILFAFLYFKTRSIWPGIACHFIVNSLAVIAIFAA